MVNASGKEILLIDVSLKGTSGHSVMIQDYTILHTISLE